MRRLRDLIGLPVIALKTEERLGWVTDVIFDEDSNEIKAIMVQKDSLLNKTIETIARGNVISIGKDGMIVDKYRSEEIFGSVFTRKVGSSVYSKDGELRGQVDDIFVNEKITAVLGYEITDGLFADITKGREVVLEENILTEGQDVIVIEGGSVS